MTLTDAEIQTFVVDWYRKLDVHVPMVEILPLLADADLEMHFPEVIVRGHVDFEAWYQRVIRTFFDELHEVKQLDVTIEGNTATVHVVVQWEASFWHPPDAESKQIVVDAYQHWVLQRSPQTGKPMIVTYIVDKFAYHEGSATL
ncbi:MAG: hypothetical protein HC837_07190 [Chloroflexaceae bacterium]|nr:hypothetical protein [Chloroflexaceae bacterium]